MVSARFSPDGTRIVTASYDPQARVWDVTTGKQLAELRGHESWVRSACFSCDGARIVTTSADHTARLWDATTGRELAVLRGHQSWVQSACFSLDGAHVITASDDRTVRIWDGVTRKEVARIALDAGVTSLDVRSGAIALGDALGRIHVYDADEFLRAESPVGG